MASSKSDTELLQDFIGSLLNDPGIEFDLPNLEHSEIQSELIEPTLVIADSDTTNNKYSEKSSAKLAKTEIKITAISEKPLYSERIERAQSLLKAMPDVSDVMQHPEVSELPTVLLPNNLVNDVLLESPDDIIITEGLEQQEPKQSVGETEFVVELDLEETIEVEEKVIESPIKAIPSPLQDGIPEWGRGEFQTLLFNVGTLKLAVPLVKLGGIHKIDPKPTPMPENPDWFLGLVADSVGNISLIDTALWIMPEKYQVAKSKGLKYELIVLLDNSRWGLACSSVDNAITLNQDDIRWNHMKSKRPWLAGMLAEEMCALVDVDTLLLMLNSETPINALSSRDDEEKGSLLN